MLRGCSYLCDTYSELSVIIFILTRVVSGSNDLPQEYSCLNTFRTGNVAHMTTVRFCKKSGVVSSASV